jgi:RNA polymerase sigma-70 factor (ECF subfamily)
MMDREDAPAGQVEDRAADVRLARAAGSGEIEARRQLVLRLLDRVRNTARYLLRDDADADDAAQSAMIEILRSAGDYRGEGPLASWASRIAARTTLAWARRRRRDDVPPEPVRQEASRAGSSVERSGDDFLLRRRLVECLDRMPVERRATVVLRLVHGLTLAEIAQETAVPLNTAKDRLRVGRQELRRLVLEDPLLRDAVKERLP